MEEDKLSFLDQPRGADGRFAAKEKAEETPTPEVKEAPAVEKPEPAKAETPAPAAPPVSPAEPPPASVPAPVQAPPSVPPGYVPLAAQLDEREKRQRLERELEDWKRKYEEAQKPAEPIDPIGDPDGFNASIDQRIARARFDAIATSSRYYAGEKHGEEAIKAAEEWLAEEVKTNPALWQQIQNNPHPYDFVVKQHKRSQLLSQMGEDPDAWVKKRAAELGLLAQAPAAPAPVAAAPSPQPTPLPKPSLASAPAAAGSAPRVSVGEGVAFDSVFQ